VVWTW